MPADGHNAARSHVDLRHGPVGQVGEGYTHTVRASGHRLPHTAASTPMFDARKDSVRIVCGE